VAGRARLTPRTRFAALAVLVLLLHALALQWLAQQLTQRSALLAMATPMFTRLLHPQAPPEAPPPAPAAAPAQPKRSGITSVKSAKSKAPAPKRPASQALASEPQPSSQPAAAEPAVPAQAAAEPSTSDSATPAAVATTGGASAPTTPPGTSDGTPAASTPEVTSTIAQAASAASSPVAAAPSPSSPTPDPGKALASWPADTRLTYQLGGYFRGELHGDARVQWQRQDDQDQARVDIDLTLLARVILTSQGQVTPRGLMPRIYEEMRRSGPRTARLREHAITLNDGRTLPRPDGVQDTASQFVELSHRFATGQEKLEVGRSVSLWMARPGGLDLWVYDIVEREVLQTPSLGPIEAWRLKPRPIANPRGNITAEIWFAPSLQYLPVRIRVHMGESTYVDLLVEKIEQQ
jgi:hypothetical protein